MENRFLINSWGMRVGVRPMSCVDVQYKNLPSEIFRPEFSTRECKVLVFWGSDLFTRMFCTFCPPTILGGLCRVPEKSPKSSADKM